MSTISWKTLLMEVVENRSYEKGYCDGLANGRTRTRGRDQGIKIARRQITKALQSEGFAAERIAEIVTPVSAVKCSLPIVRSTDDDAESDSRELHQD